MFIIEANFIEEKARRPPTGIGGLWRNRLGSTMELTVSEDHRISGTFTTGVGVPDTTREYPVTGFAEGDAVSFCVDFGRRGSVASWAGHHISDDTGERLVTLWHLAQPVTDAHGETDTWRALMAGADEFTRA